MSQTFTVGDKVFAKVRGYPAWPARVEKIEGEPSNKRKFHVFFYGTYETGVCKIGDLYHYEDFKKMYGKPIKRRSFAEAMSEIEGLSPVREIKIENSGKPSLTERLKTVSKPTERRKRPGKRKQENEYDQYDEKTNKNTKYMPPQKRLKRGNSLQSDKVDTTVSLESLEEIINCSSSKSKRFSRSGRKIKPKKFADGENFDTVTSSRSKNADLNLESQIVSSPEPESPQQNGCSTGMAFKHTVRLRVKSTEDINNSVENRAAALKKDNEDRRAVQSMDASSFKSYCLKWYRNETRMLELEGQVKKNLSLSKKAKTSESIELLTQLENLHIEPLMLKKHPAVVKTVRTLRRYVGNCKAWNLTPVEQEQFQAEALQIRKKAICVFNKLQSKFIIPDDQSFYEWFLNQVSAFRRKTATLTLQEICSLVIDPTLASGDHDDTQFCVEIGEMSDNDPVPTSSLIDSKTVVDNGDIDLTESKPKVLNVGSNVDSVEPNTTTNHIKEYSDNEIMLNIQSEDSITDDNRESFNTDIDEDKI